MQQNKFMITIIRASKTRDTFNERISFKRRKESFVAYILYLQSFIIVILLEATKDMRPGLNPYLFIYINLIIFLQWRLFLYS